MQSVYAPVPLATIKKCGAQVVAQLFAQRVARRFGGLGIGLQIAFTSAMCLCLCWYLRFFWTIVLRLALP